MSTAISFRTATRDDVPRIAWLLADDIINGHREQAREPVPQSYYVAFDAIAADPAHALIVGEVDGLVIACAQLSFLPQLVQQGAMRALIEGVRVASTHRSGGYGEKLIMHLAGIARARGCVAVQLTTSKPRVDAQRFYARLGFANSHEGYKLEL